MDRPRDTQEDAAARRQNGPSEVSAQRARQAIPLGGPRYVLYVSLALIVAAFAVIYFLYF